jgi:hypothetical protein
VATQEPEVGARGQDHLGNGHQGLVRDIAIGKDHLVDLVRGDERAEFGLRLNGNPLRVMGTGQTGRIPAPGYRWDLGGGERHHLD